MITTLSGTKVKVEISPDGPTVIIGERINPTGRSRFAAALANKDWEVIRQEAVTQIEQGAHDRRVAALWVDRQDVDLPAIKDGCSRVGGAKVDADGYAGGVGHVRPAK